MIIWCLTVHQIYISLFLSLSLSLSALAHNVHCMITLNSISIVCFVYINTNILLQMLTRLERNFATAPSSSLGSSLAARWTGSPAGPKMPSLRYPTISYPSLRSSAPQRPSLRWCRPWVRCTMEWPLPALSTLKGELKPICTSFGQGGLDLPARSLTGGYLIK